MSNKQEELRSWRIATFVMVTLAAAVFLIQRFIGQVFDLIFEVCVFYIPAVAVVFLLLYFRKKSS